MMYHTLLRRCLVAAWAVWLLVGTTLALSHRHEHVECSVASQHKTATLTASHSHGHGCRHSHKHQHSSSQSHTHSHATDHDHLEQQQGPANSPVPCRHDDCSLCQFLGLHHSAPPSVTIVRSEVCLAIVAVATKSQCEAQPTTTVAAPRAPPQSVVASC